MITRNLDKARSAYLHHDPEQSKKAHKGGGAPEEHQTGGGQSHNLKPQCSVLSGDVPYNISPVV